MAGEHTEFQGRGVLPPFDAKAWADPGQSAGDNAQIIGNILLARSLQLQPNLPLESHKSQVAEHLPHLVPKCGRGVANHMFGLSPVFQDETGRRGVLAYHVLPGFISLPVLFYKSNSHAVWRAMLVKGEGGWAAKDMFGVENSADAPLALQKTFDEREAKQAEIPTVSLPLINAIPDQGGGWGNGSHAQKLAEAKMKVAGIDDTPAYDASAVVATDGSLLSAVKAPDLDSVHEAWTTDENLYGKVAKLVCPSLDKTLNYLINITGHEGIPQAWVGTIEISESAISQLAIARRFVKIPEAISKPPIDYGQNDKYGTRRENPTQLDEFVVDWLDRRSEAAQLASTSLYNSSN